MFIFATQHFRSCEASSSSSSHLSFSWSQKIAPNCFIIVKTPDTKSKWKDNEVNYSKKYDQRDLVKSGIYPLSISDEANMMNEHRRVTFTNRWLMCEFHDKFNLLSFVKIEVSTDGQSRNKISYFSMKHELMRLLFNSKRSNDCKVGIFSTVYDAYELAFYLSQSDRSSCNRRNSIPSDWGLFF